MDKDGLRKRRPDRPTDSDDRASFQDNDDSQKKSKNSSQSKNGKKMVQWRCIDSCCWAIGNLCFLYGLIMVVYHAIPRSQLQQIEEAIMGKALPDPPGVVLIREGATLKHPVMFVPGIVTGGLELWEGKPCAEGLFRKRLWGGTFGEVYKRPKCWMEHMTLDNETGLDPPGIRVRPVEGLVAADYFMPGYFVWAVIIEQLARLGYDERSMHMASYDWRLSYLNTQERDRSLSRIKAAIEVLVESNHGHKVVVVPHSMGSIYFLFFLKWVEAPAPMGGGGGPTWVADHIHAVVNIAGPLLGVPKAFTGLFSAEGKDVAVARELSAADKMMDGLQTLQYVMSVSRTWDSTMSLLPKGGDAVWGGLDWAPEEKSHCKGLSSSPPAPKSPAANTTTTSGAHGHANFGRMVSFGREAALLPAADLPKAREACHWGEGGTGDAEVVAPDVPQKARNMSCGDVWTEYQEMSWSAVQEVARRGVYTAGNLPDLLRRVAPRLMARGDKDWGFGVAENPSAKEYNHPKYWSNPLQTSLPNAPDMEVFCLYGVGLPTERSYIYKLSPYNDTCLIPFRIDTSVDSKAPDRGLPIACLERGVFFVDGDETVPALSAGYMCQKGWKGKTRYNPSGAKAYNREYAHAPPVSFLEGRGTQSGSHVDVMGNFALVEDILRIATGTSGKDLGGDRVYSAVSEWSEKVRVKL
eukprot:TRINITY_DN22599_c0_g1_i1.p1 TRINITY_DN22599_c0_g1~~TRINITY_DN22599_c0_g1_i1.p1  ORF type:complete len:693 (-),score=108.54 TRINITY_DN22599_c0_g1_i1:1267-3345(-)